MRSLYSAKASSPTNKKKCELLSFSVPLVMIFERSDVNKLLSLRVSPDSASHRGDGKRQEAMQWRSIRIFSTIVITSIAGSFHSFRSDGLWGYPSSETSKVKFLCGPPSHTSVFIPCAGSLYPIFYRRRKKTVIIYRFPAAPLQSAIQYN